MTVINEYKDPMSGKVNHFAKGSIKFVNIKPVKNADADGVKRTHIPARNGQPAKVIESTHTISFLMQPVDENNNVVDPAADGQWISMGEKKLHPSHASKVQVKFDAGYKDILPGMVVSFPLKISKNGDKQYANGTLSGKVFNILDESKATATPVAQQSTGSSQQGSGASNNSGGKTTKVFGEVISVSDFGAQIKTDNGEVSVKLSAEQLSQIQVGGRMGGQRSEDGAIVNSFKAYGPAGSSAGKGSNGGKTGGRDTTGVEVGHAINGALNIHRNGLKNAPVVEIAKVVHDTTKLLKQESAKDAAHKGLSDYDLGAMVGHAVLNATRDIEVSESDNPETITGKILEYSRALISEVVPGVTSYIKGETPTAVSEESKSEPNLTASQVTGQPEESLNDNGHVDYAQDEIDFDDDVPFAYLGLQYPSHAIHVLF